MKLLDLRMGFASRGQVGESAQLIFVSFTLHFVV